MTYDKERDLLGMYRFKCEKCSVKFLDQPSLILHYRMIHNLIAKGSITQNRTRPDIKILNELKTRTVVNLNKYAGRF